MKSFLASVRNGRGLDRVETAVRTLEEEWRHGEPSLQQRWAESDPEALRKRPLRHTLAALDFR